MTNQNKLFNDNEKEHSALEEFDGNYSKNNTLNDLTGKNWLKFTKTWFIYDGPQRKENEMLHPAKYPEGMIIDFVKFFTKAGELVLDPFLGTGSTLVACNQSGRNGVGIELMEKYARIAKSRVSQVSLANNVTQKVIIGNSMNIPKIWKENDLPFVDFIICSPPYWNMLKKSRGGVISAQKERQNKGLDTHYSEEKSDLGNIDDYELFVSQLARLMKAAFGVLKKGKYAVIIIQNMRDTDGAVKPLAWDLTRAISQQGNIDFVGEKIWCQDNKKLGIWGYPKIFVPNYHHHYCLIFRKRNN